MGFLILIPIWHVVSVAIPGASFFVPSPFALASEMRSLPLVDFRNAVLSSVGAWALALTSSAIIGVPLGLLFGLNRLARDYFGPVVHFARAIPPSALFFLFVFVFGLGFTTKVAVAVYGCTLVVVVGAWQGTLSTPLRRTRLEMAASIGLSRTSTLFFVRLPDALPEIATSIRIAGGLAFVLVVVTEMFLGAETGLGKLLYDSYLRYAIPRMYIIILLLGTLGWIADSLLRQIENTLTRWHDV